MKFQITFKDGISFSVTQERAWVKKDQRIHMNSKIPLMEKRNVCVCVYVCVCVCVYPHKQISEGESPSMAGFGVIFTTFFDYVSVLL